VVPEPVTTTTVHDHSTHSHGPKLPQTGTGIGWLWGIVLIITGYILFFLGAKPQKPKRP
jgi:hypothetical protein